MGKSTISMVDSMSDLFGLESYLSARGGRHREVPSPVVRRPAAAGKPYDDFATTHPYSTYRDAWEDVLEERQIIETVDIRLLELAVLYHAPCRVHVAGPKYWSRSLLVLDEAYSFLLSTTNDADGSSVYRTIGKRLPMVQANQFQLIAANGVPTSSRPVNVLLYFRAAALAQSLYELMSVATMPLEGVVPGGVGQPVFQGGPGGGIIVGRTVGPNTRVGVVPALGGLTIVPVVSDTNVAQAHTAIIHGGGMAIVGQELSFLDAILFRVMTCGGGQIVYESDASAHTAGARTESFGAVISRWDDDWIGLPDVVCISDLAYQQANALFPPAVAPPPLVLHIDGAVVRSMMADFDPAQISASMKRIAAARREEDCLEMAYYFVRELRPFEVRGPPGMPRGIPQNGVARHPIGNMDFVGPWGPMREVAMPTPAACAEYAVALSVPLDNALPVITSDTAFVKSHGPERLLISDYHNFMIGSACWSFALHHSNVTWNAYVMTLDAGQRDAGYAAAHNLPLAGRGNEIIEVAKSFESEPLPQQPDMVNTMSVFRELATGLRRPHLYFTFCAWLTFRGTAIAGHNDHHWALNEVPYLVRRATAIELLARLPGFFLAPLDGDMCELTNGIIAETPQDGTPNKLPNTTHFALWQYPRQSTGFRLVYETIFFLMTFVANFGNAGTNWIRQVQRQLLSNGRATQWVMANGVAFTLDAVFNARPGNCLGPYAALGAAGQFPGLGSLLTYDLFTSKEISYWLYHHGDVQPGGMILMPKYNYRPRVSFRPTPSRKTTAVRPGGLMYMPAAKKPKLSEFVDPPKTVTPVAEKSIHDMAEGERAVLLEAMMAQALQSEQLQQAFLNRLTQVISATPQQTEAMVGSGANRSTLNLLQSAGDTPNADGAAPAGATTAAPSTVNYGGAKEAASLRDAIANAKKPSLPIKKAVEDIGQGSGVEVDLGNKSVFGGTSSKLSSSGATERSQSLSIKPGNKEPVSAQATALTSIFGTALESLNADDIEKLRKRALADPAGLLSQLAKNV